MIYFLLFILELLTLFFLAKKLTNCLATIIYRITKSHKIVVNTLAVIFLPGTIVHELAHLFSAGMMLVPVGEMSFIPEIQENGVKLGSVQIGITDPIRRSIIGVAPILVGIASILGILLFVKSQNPLPFWQILIALYLVFEIGNTMFSSKKDLEGVIGFVFAILVVLLIVLSGLYFLKPDLFQIITSWIISLNYEFAINFFKLGSLYLLAPVMLDILIIVITKPLRR